MKTYEEVLQLIKRRRRTWLVTGAAGFIGSNLVEKLLSLDQEVVGLDNFSTGKRENVHKEMRLVEGDIRSLETCRAVCRGVDLVLHQAALGSVPRSIERPLATHDANVNGFLNMLMATREAGIARFVFASSSAVFGDDVSLPKVEERVGRALSPYGLSKHINELYAGVFGRCYGLRWIGLRYFNVFGPRQDADGPYASVIPAWIGALLRGVEPLGRLLAAVVASAVDADLLVNLTGLSLYDGSNQPKNPSLFMRTPGSLVGHGEAIVRPLESIQFDYEGELVMVVGKGGRRIPAEKARDHVFGLTLMNEGSVRDWIRHGKFNVTQGKNFDRSGAIGPWIVTTDDLPGFEALTLTTEVNGEVRQRGATAELMFSFEKLIAYISTFTTLSPGDIISTGTPVGAGARFDPPRWLKPGDVVRVASPQIGVLSNEVADEAA